MCLEGHSWTAGMGALRTAAHCAHSPGFTVHGQSQPWCWCWCCAIYCR